MVWPVSDPPEQLWMRNRLSGKKSLLSTCSSDQGLFRPTLVILGSNSSYHGGLQSKNPNAFRPSDVSTGNKYPSDQQYKPDKDKMRSNSGPSHFPFCPNVFFPRFRRFRAVRPKPVLFRSPTKIGSPTPAEVARNHHPHFEPPVKSLPIFC